MLRIDYIKMEKQFYLIQQNARKDERIKFNKGLRQVNGVAFRS